MNPPVVEVRDLVVRAGRRRILDIGSLQIPAGEITAIMGRNGAGKTTLLRTFLGLAKPDEGRVEIFGCDVAGAGSRQLARIRRRIGYVPQQAPLIGEMRLTVREVAVTGRAGKTGLFHPLTPQDWQIAEFWLEQLGLTGLREQSFAETSGGEQRKAMIARAMAQEPELLLLDEPGANLDLGWRERIVETIRELSARVTTVLVCHELEMIPLNCRHLVILEEGRPAAAGSPSEVLTPERVTALYGAAFEVIHHAGRHAAIPRGAADV